MNSIQACCAWIALLLLSVAIGCHGEPGPQWASSQAIKATVFASGTQSGVEESGLVLCTDNKSWAELWDRHMGQQSLKSPLPVVSFANENVLAVFLGDRPTTGYSVAVEGLEQRSSDWILHTREKRPLAEAATLQVETRPFAFLIVPKHVSEVDWEPAP